MIYGFLETPVGRLLVARDTTGVRLIHFVGPAEAGPYVESDWQQRDDAFDDVATQLAEYFGGGRRVFELPLAPEGTPFQLRVGTRSSRFLTAKRFPTVSSRRGSVSAPHRAR